MLNLKDLEAKLDSALLNETNESMFNWIIERRQSKEASLNENILNQFRNIQLPETTLFVTFEPNIIREHQTNGFENYRQKTYTNNDWSSDFPDSNFIPVTQENPFVFGTRKSQQNVRPANRISKYFEMEIQ